MKRVDRVEVKPGQVWEDCDWRNVGRRVRVESVDVSYAHCVTVMETGGVVAARPRKTRILLERMRPMSTGFRLVEDAKP